MQQNLLLLWLRFQKIQIHQQNFKQKNVRNCGHGPTAKYRNVLDVFINLTSTNRGFRTVHHSVSTYEQTKKGLCYFYPKKILSIVDTDGIHTRPL